VPFFARDLNFSFFGWPFSFWVASQGALIGYLVIAWTYARLMNRHDRRAASSEE
jgi:putative solute:sodium symporter small subunit